MDVEKELVRKYFKISNPYEEGILKVVDLEDAVEIAKKVLHTKGSNVAQGWDYPVKPNGLSTDGAADVLASFDFSAKDAEND